MKNNMNKTPKNINELFTEITAIDCHPTLDIISVHENFNDVIKKRMDNPYLFHPRVIELKNLIKQQQLNIIQIQASIDYDRKTVSVYDNQTIESKNKKAIAISNNVIGLLSKELIGFQIFCTHKKIDNALAQIRVEGTSKYSVKYVNLYLY